MLATWEKTQNKPAREQVHLHVKTGRFVKKNKVTSSLAPIQRPGHSARNCKNGRLSFSHTQAVKKEYHPQKLRIFLKRFQN